MAQMHDAQCVSSFKKVMPHIVIPLMAGMRYVASTTTRVLNINNDSGIDSEHSHGSY